MTSSEPPAIRINQPGELIEAIPYLLGFHPENSLVLIGFAGDDIRDGPGRVQVALRIDLPNRPVSITDLIPALAALEHSGVTSVVIAVFTDAECGQSPTTDSLRAVADSARVAVRAAGQQVLDVLVADNQTWRSLMCYDDNCCPPAGNPRTRDRSMAAAAATFAGLVALPHRAALADQIAGLSEQSRHRLDGYLSEAEDRITRAVLENRWRRTVRMETTAILRAAARRANPTADGSRLAGRQIARFGVALRDIGIRDGIWLAIDEGSLDASALLYELHTRLPAPYDASPMFLYGWHNWRQGNGTMAGIAAERALASVPGYSAALLLLTAVRSGLDPRTTPALREPELNTDSDDIRAGGYPV